MRFMYSIRTIYTPDMNTRRRADPLIFYLGKPVVTTPQIINEHNQRTTNGTRPSQYSVKLPRDKHQQTKSILTIHTYRREYTYVQKTKNKREDTPQTCMAFDFVFEVEDQRDWQRRTGCSKNPFSCFFCHLLEIVAPETEIHDITYGVGSFYQHCSHKQIFAADIKRWPWIVKPAEFKQTDALEYLRELSSENRYRRVVIIDPPFSVHPVGNSRHYEYLYYPKPWPFEYLKNVLQEARAKSRIVILKYMGHRKEEAELTAMANYVIIWRFFKSRIFVNKHNLVVRNASKIFIFLTM